MAGPLSAARSLSPMAASRPTSITAPGRPTPNAIVVDADTTAAMEQHLEEHASDMASRFAVLRYLWTSWLAGSAADDENAAEKAVRAEAHTALLDFVGRLAAESIATPEQAMWEFKQAFILSQWERLKRLGGRYTALSRDDLNLLLARALWFCNSRHWASVVLSLVTGHEDEDLAWEPLIDGDQLLVSSSAGLPPESHEAALSKDLVLYAIDCMRNVQPEGRCLPASNSINTGYRNKGLDKSSGLCHR